MKAILEDNEICLYMHYEMAQCIGNCLNLMTKHQGLEHENPNICRGCTAVKNPRRVEYKPQPF